MSKPKPMMTKLAHASKIPPHKMKTNKKKPSKTKETAKVIGKTKSGLSVFAPNKALLALTQDWIDFEETDYKPRAYNTARNKYIAHVKAFAVLHGGFETQDHLDASKIHEKLSNSKSLKWAEQVAHSNLAVVHHWLTLPIKKATKAKAKKATKPAKKIVKAKKPSVFSGAKKRVK